MVDMRIQTMTETGLASFEDYKHSLGYLEAMRQVLAAIDEVQDEQRK